MGFEDIVTDYVENEGPIQVTTGGGYEAFESPNGQLLYYIKSRDRRGLWSVPRDGGPERLVATGPRESRWAATERGILFLDGPNVRLYDFTSGEVEAVGTIPTVTLRATAFRPLQMAAISSGARPTPHG